MMEHDSEVMHLSHGAVSAPSGNGPLKDPRVRVIVRSQPRHAPTAASSAADSDRLSSFPTEQTPMEWTDIEPEQFVGSAEVGPRPPETKQRALTTTRSGTSAPGKMVASRSLAGSGEEFIVSPSPLAIALASEKGQLEKTAPQRAFQGQISSNPSVRQARASSLGSLAQPELGVPATYQTASDVVQRRLPLSRMPPPPSVPLPKRPLTRSLPGSQSDSNQWEHSDPSLRTSVPATARRQPLHPAPKEGLDQRYGSAIDTAPGTLPAQSLLQGSIAVPPILVSWVASADAVGVLSKVLEVAGGRLRGVEQGVVHFEADEEEAVQEAQALLQNHLNHKAGIEEKRRLKRELEVIEQEFQAGLRCEFRVPMPVLPYVLGPQGHHLTQVQSECGVDRVLLDRADGTIRIAGRRKKDVDAARARLEYDTVSLHLARSLWVGSGPQVADMLGRVRSKYQLALAEVQEEGQGLVRLVGRKTLFAGAVRMVEGQLQLLEMLQAEVDEVADVSEEQVQRMSRAWGVHQAGPAHDRAAHPLPAGPVPTVDARAPLVRAEDPRPTDGEWEDIEPPLLEPTRHQATGWGETAGALAPVQSEGAPHPRRQLGPPRDARVGGSPLGAPGSTPPAATSPTGWGSNGSRPPYSDRAAGTAQEPVNLAPLGGAPPFREGRTEGGSSSRGGVGTGPALEHGARAVAAPLSRATEPQIVTRRPITATQHRLARSVFADVVSSRQREGAPTGWAGAASPKGKIGGGVIKRRGEAEQQRQEERQSGVGVSVDEQQGAIAAGGETRYAEQEGPGQQEAEFWTLGSPPSNPGSHPEHQEQAEGTWDADWPTSGVPGHVDDGQQLRQPQSDVPTTLPIVLPSLSASASQPHTSEHASSGWGGQRRSVASGSLTSSQQSGSASQGAASSGVSVRGILQPPHANYEVIDARIIQPPDVSGLLRTPISRASPHSGVLPSPIYAQQAVVNFPRAVAPFSRPAAAALPSTARDAQQVERIVVMSGSEGWVPRGSLPPAHWPTGKSAPNSRLEPGPTRPLPAASGASLGSSGGGRGAPSRVVSSASSTGSTSNLKLAQRESAQEGVAFNRDQGSGAHAIKAGLSDPSSSRERNEAAVQRREANQEPALRAEPGAHHQARAEPDVGHAASVESLRGSEAGAMGAAEVAEAQAAPGEPVAKGHGLAAHVTGWQDGGDEQAGRSGDAHARVGEEKRVGREDSANESHEAAVQKAGLDSRREMGTEAVPREAVGQIGRNEPRPRKWASETSEEEQRAGHGEHGLSLEPRGQNGRPDFQPVEAAAVDQRVITETPSGWGDIDIEHGNRGENAPSGWEAPQQQQLGRLHEEPPENPFAAAPGWGPRPASGVQPWSDEGLPRGPHALPSGSGRSDDSGSVRSVGIDVGRWAEDAAIGTLSEHEAMLHESPNGFEGATDSGSGHGASSGSSRAGSSEGRRGAGYRLKMQRFQLAAIKANQTGGGAPTGWDAVPEEGSELGGSAHGWPTAEQGPVSLPPLPSPAATPPSPISDTRSWVRLKMRDHPLPHAAPPDRRPAVIPVYRAPQRVQPQQSAPPPISQEPAPPAREQSRALRAAEEAQASGWGDEAPHAAAAAGNGIEVGQASGWGEGSPKEAGAGEGSAAREAGWEESESATQRNRWQGGEKGTGHLMGAAHTEQEAAGGTVEAAPTGWGNSEGGVAPAVTTAQREAPYAAEVTEDHASVTRWKESESARQQTGRRGGERTGRGPVGAPYPRGPFPAEQPEPAGIEAQGGPTGWGNGDGGREPAVPTSQSAAYLQGNENEQWGQIPDEYEARENGDSVQIVGQPTGWADVGVGRQEERDVEYPSVAAAEHGRQEAPQEIYTEGPDAVDEACWDEQDDLRDSDDTGSSQSEYQPQASLRAGAQDVRLEMGVGAGGTMQRSEQGLSGGRVEGGRRVGVQDARLLPAEGPRPLSNRAQKRAARDLERKLRRRAQRTASGEGGMGRSPMAGNGGHVIAENGTPTPSGLPPTGWKPGATFPDSPASTLHPVEQPSPGRMRRPRGGRGRSRRSRDEGGSSEREGWTGAEAQSSKMTGGDGILGQGNWDSAPQESPMQQPTGWVSREQVQGSEAGHGRGEAHVGKSGGYRDDSFGGRHWQRSRAEVALEFKPSTESSDRARVPAESREQSLPEVDTPSSSVSGGQRPSSGQAAKRAARPSGVWSVRERRETPTSST